MRFDLTLEPEAYYDIQEAISWYNDQKAGLGTRFYNQIIKEFSKLGINPFYQIRYGNVHCLPMKKFPFMIHFTINDSTKLVSVKAVLHTSSSPSAWLKR